MSFGWVSKGVCLCCKTVYFYGVQQSIFMILHPKWTPHFISYTDFGHTLRHEKCTKWYENWQALSLWFQIVAVCPTSKFKSKLEQLERLRSEDTPRCLMITHTIESYWIKVKRRQSQSYKFKKIAKISNFWILKRALQSTHLLKLLDKMCKYEIDLMSIVEDTERTRFCPQKDRRTRWYQYTPLSTSLKRRGWGGGGWGVGGGGCIITSI